MNYRTLLAVSVLAISSLARATDQQVEILLAHMREAYRSVKSATYKTETTIYPPDAASQTFSLDFAYKSPNLIRVIIKLVGSDAMITKISNGKTITSSLPVGAGKPLEFTYDNYEKDLIANLESFCFWDWDRQLSTTPGKNMALSTFKLVKDEEWNGKHWMVLEETAKKDDVLCRYFIDPKTYIIWRTRVKSLTTGKDELDSHITKLDTQAGLSDDSFTGS